MPPTNIKAKGKSGKTIEQTYQKKTQLEHILLRPDTYIGSIEKVSQSMWVHNTESERIHKREISYVPGLYKIFDEIMVNAADNKQRDPTMDKIKVTVDQENNSVSVWNNGKGIPVVMHSEHQVYVPELIFGHLLTGSNFDDDEKKTTGGRNGYGAKLANIFSTEFTIETSDSQSGKKYKQTFKNNMGTKMSPSISKASGSDYTCVTFKPDLARFKMSSLDDDTVALLCKRVYDIAGTSTSAGSRLQVFLNGKKLPVKSFQDYIKLYDGIEEITAWEKVNERWEIGIGISDGQFTQVSFVNSICTTKGGQHANYVADKVINKLAAVVKRKNKGEEVKGHFIKNHIAVYVNCLVENPAFDSQTKETLTTKPSAFGSDVSLSDKFLKQVEKGGIVDRILSWAKYKQNEQLKRKGGSKKTKLSGITKLDDANHAGGAKSKDCTLILTEGDSAKSLAVSGLSIVGRDYYGVFPLKGKPLNVREANHSIIMKNEEIQNICKILGLRHGVTYTDTKELRYGHLLIMADQDHDGSHIKGLLINFIHHFWPSLLKLPGFLQQFITPIVRVTKGKKSQSFFTIPEYEDWKEDQPNNAKGWGIKYFKGLGTSTAKDAKEYFADLDTHRIDFENVVDMQACDGIDMAFSKKRVQDRKDWLNAFVPGTFINYGVSEMSYADFVNRELVLFSLADNQRSIPSVMDGFKPSQRKVLFACFKRKLKNELKVAQLSGYVSEHAAYHHGEMSLNGTIVGMAQDYVGANNINLLFPSGQFGTRLQGGKDSASVRYIFTRLEAITRTIFHPEDDQLLKYLDDDGQSIEPEHYSPVLPTVLVNGSEGIGTGWSTFVPNYNPLDIIEVLRLLLNGEESIPEIHPWYRGFTGEIEAKGGKDQGSYTVRGAYNEIDENTIEITELPVRTWTISFKERLESMLPGAADSKDAGLIKDFKENHTDRTVSFTVVFADGVLDKIKALPGGIMKKLKLESNISTNNMMLFNSDGHIKKYNTAADIIAEYYGPRLELYGKRKDAMVAKLEAEHLKLSNQVRFILAVVDGELVVSKKAKTILMQELQTLGYAPITSNAPKATNTDDDETEEGDSSDEEGGIPAKGYDYLLSMKLWSLTLERVADLREQLNNKEEALEALRLVSPEEMWLEDLDNVQNGLVEMENLLHQNAKEEEKTRKIAQKKGPNAKKGKKATKNNKSKKKAWEESDDSEEDDFDDDISDDDEDFAVTKPKKKPAAATTTRKPLAARPGAVKAALPKPIVAAVAPKPKAPSPPPLEEDKEDSSDEEMMSLADRMRLKMDKTAAGKKKNSSLNTSSGDDIFNMANSDEEVEVVPVAKKVTKAKTVTATKKVATTASTKRKKSNGSDDSDDEFNNDDEEVVPKKKAAPKRAAAAKNKAKNKAIVDIDSDDEFNDDEEEVVPKKKAAPKRAAAAKNKAIVDIDSDDEFNDDEEEVVPKKKAAPKRAAAAKKAIVNSDDDAPVVTKKKTGQKRPAATAKSTKVLEMNSDRSEDESPPTKKATVRSPFDMDDSSESDNLLPSKKNAVAKKTTKAPAKKTTAASKAKATTGKKPAVGKKAATKPVVAKKANKKKSIESSEEEDNISDDESEPEVTEVVRRSPKPVRQRKVTKYVESESEEDDFGSESEEEDDGDSEFE